LNKLNLFLQVPSRIEEREASSAVASTPRALPRPEGPEGLKGAPDTNILRQVIEKIPDEQKRPSDNFWHSCGR